MKAKFRKVYPETLLAIRNSESGCLCGSFDPESWDAKLPGEKEPYHIADCHRIIAAGLLGEKIVISVQYDDDLDEDV